MHSGTPVRWSQGRVYGVGTWVGYGDRVGTGRGNTGTPSHRARSPADSEAGPGTSLQGRWSGWSAGRARVPGTTLRARSVWPRQPSLYQGPAFQSNGRANLKKPRFQSFYSKVSQNDEVSPKKCHKAYHSPYFQNGSQISPLEILRFPFWPAFSCKELMGLF